MPSGGELVLVAVLVVVPGVWLPILGDTPPSNQQTEHGRIVSTVMLLGLSGLFYGVCLSPLALSSTCSCLGGGSRQPCSHMLRAIDSASTAVCLSAYVA